MIQQQKPKTVLLTHAWMYAAMALFIGLWVGFIWAGAAEQHRLEVHGEKQ